MLGGPGWGMVEENLQPRVSDPTASNTSPGNADPSSGVKPQSSFGKENVSPTPQKKTPELTSKIYFTSFRKVPQIYQERSRTNSSSNLRVTTAGHQAGIGGAKLLLRSDLKKGVMVSSKPGRVLSGHKLKTRTLSPSESKGLLRPMRKDGGGSGVGLVSSPIAKSSLRVIGQTLSMSLKKHPKREAARAQQNESEEEKTMHLKLFRNSVSGTEVREQLSNSALEGGRDVSKLSWFLRRSIKKA